MRKTTTRWPWRKTLGVGLLTVVAALAGIQSEILAQQGNSQTYTVRGSEMDGNMSGFDTSPTAWSSSANFQVNSQVTGPGQATATTTIWVIANTNDWVSGQTQLLGSGNIAASSFSANIQGNGATGTVNATVPGNYQSWNNSGWVNTPVQVTLNAQLSSPNVFTESSRNQTHSRLNQGGGNFFTSNYQNAKTAVDPTGTAGLTYNDGVNNYTYVPAGTSVWGGNLRDLSSGQHTVTTH